MVISIHFEENQPRRDIEYRIHNTEEKRSDTGEFYRVVEAQSKNETEERISGTACSPNS
jgi:hypothetical protein